MHFLYKPDNRRWHFRFPIQICWIQKCLLWRQWSSSEYYSVPLLICTWFLKNQVVKSSLTNWIFSLQKSILKLIFAGYTSSKNPVRNRQKIQFIEHDFSKLIFQKSSTDHQRENLNIADVFNNRIRLIIMLYLNSTQILSWFWQKNI